ncbi:hypothetical protein FZEAL_9630 [Fusarium zealandicum]|uniref:Mating-type switching protein swi10 n=1 Tax=Fusarium zealandicum TaxID=1053134 RepID=A0A8H4U9H6_9HYPO|nr:hypothetical protein FZEAL_9630 [Fusarium zealandicum]
MENLHSLKPPRRKLQKSDPKLKSVRAKRSSADSTASHSDSAMSSPLLGRSQNGAPDLSDAKWSHYLRPKTVVSPTFSEPHQSPISPMHTPAPLWSVPTAPATEPDLEPRAFFRSPRQRHSFQRPPPEFSHLTIQDTSARPSLDSSSMPSPSSSTSTISTMRRQAKTPVFRIGQLEQHALARKCKDAPEKTSSVELIADQYRTFLESRDGPAEPESHQDDRAGVHSAKQPTLQVPPYSPLRLSQRSSRTQSRVVVPPPRHSRPKLQSVPTHDTNVAAFEGDTIYFKPYSFSPPPSPDPSPDQQDAFGTPSPSGQSYQENVSLQIALDLLTSELSSAVAGRSQYSGQETASLQIWVMIEAYERLRDQVVRMESLNGEAGRVSIIFDCWLASLYSIHSSLASSSLPSPSIYAGLEEDLD